MRQDHFYTNLVPLKDKPNKNFYAFNILNRIYSFNSSENVRDVILRATIMR